MANKNWGFGRFVSCWWNEGKDGKQGYYTVNVRRRYKDKTGADVEEKVSMFASDAIQLQAELKAAVEKLLTLPYEIVRKEQAPEPNVQVVEASELDQIPFNNPF